MRRIDSFISFAMWSIIAMSVPVMLLLATDRSLRSPRQYTVSLCLLWLPPALSIGQLDGGPGPYSPWFYRFAILAALWLAGVGAYGITVFAA
jgi:hypothetical protein